jgi:putative ribosome biogenesis GTPase RsgA
MQGMIWSALHPIPLSFENVTCDDIKESGMKKKNTLFAGPPRCGKSTLIEKIPCRDQQSSIKI